MAEFRCDCEKQNQDKTQMSYPIANLDGRIVSESNAAKFAFDIAANRRSNKWSIYELAGRALWEIFRHPLFSWTPRPMWKWRRTVLRVFGATVGRDAHIYPTARIA